MLVHQAKRTAAEDTALASSQGFSDEERDAVLYRERLNPSGRKDRLNGPASCHTDISPAGPSDGDGPTGRGGCQASHFSIQHGVGRSVIGLPTVSKSSGDAGETASEIRHVST